jgi:hypothetical protein
MAAKCAVRHREHDIAPAMRLAGLGGGLAQDRADDFTAADKERAGEKHEKER